MDLVGALVGDSVGSWLVGNADGAAVGSERVGEAVGDAVGLEFVGIDDGWPVGAKVDGTPEGIDVGTELVGNAEGCEVGAVDGMADGLNVGEKVGASVWCECRFYSTIRSQSSKVLCEVPYFYDASTSSAGRCPGLVHGTGARPDRPYRQCPEPCVRRLDHR